MTPRQIFARCYFIERQKRLSLAGLASVFATAGRGEARDIDKLLKALQADFPT